VLASGSAVQMSGPESDCWVSTGCVTLRGRAKPTEWYEPASAVTQRVS